MTGLLYFNNNNLTYEDFKTDIGVQLLAVPNHFLSFLGWLSVFLSHFLKKKKTCLLCVCMCVCTVCVCGLPMQARGGRVLGAGVSV